VTRSLVVVKCGGRVAGEVAPAILALVAEGHQVCVVHGAGPQISAAMEAAGLEVRFVAGRRYTSADALAVVREELAQVNAELVEALGPAAVGLMGDEIELAAQQVPELGLVGEAVASAPAAVLEALAQGRVPVVAPLAAGPLNVNADDAASALAVGLGAERILFLSDVPGVLLDDAVVLSLNADDAEGMLAAGTFEGGIVPKLHAAVSAARLGVRAEIGATAVLA
jgi:acetylglutamate kinase